MKDDNILGIHENPSDWLKTFSALQRRFLDDHHHDSNNTRKQWWYINQYRHKHS